jgi:hypothetical protein
LCPHGATVGTREEGPDQPGPTPSTCGFARNLLVHEAIHLVCQRRQGEEERRSSRYCAPQPAPPDLPFSLWPFGHANLPLSEAPSGSCSTKPRDRSSLGCSTRYTREAVQVDLSPLRGRGSDTPFCLATAEGQGDVASGAGSGAGDSGLRPSARRQSYGDRFVRATTWTSCVRHRPRRSGAAVPVPACAALAGACSSAEPGVGGQLGEPGCGGSVPQACLDDAGCQHGPCSGRRRLLLGGFELFSNVC